MPKFLLTALLLLISMNTFSASVDDLALCTQIEKESKRLACYDEVAGYTPSDRVTDNAITNSSVEPSQSAKSSSGNALSSFAQENRWTLSKLESDDPNFFGISWDPTGDEERKVKRHIEFDISIKYPVWEFSKAKRLYLIYNGSYDFQALTNADIYDSKPIISTSQNPGATMEWDIGNGQRKFRAGLFHHSNGQTLSESRDDATPETLAKNALALERFNTIEDEWGQAPALERVSRSSWYAQFRYQVMSNAEGEIREDWWQYQVEVRPAYFGNDDRIFWSDDHRHQPQIENFDGIRAVGERMFPIPEPLSFLGDNVLARAELQTGLWSPLDNVGGKLTLGINFKNNLLMSLYYYSGFAKDIATYHTRTQHMGLGFELR